MAGKRRAHNYPRNYAPFGSGRNRVISIIGRQPSRATRRLDRRATAPRYALYADGLFLVKNDEDLSVVKKAVRVEMRRDYLMRAQIVVSGQVAGVVQGCKCARTLKKNVSYHDYEVLL